MKDFKVRKLVVHVESVKQAQERLSTMLQKKSWKRLDQAMQINALEPEDIRKVGPVKSRELRVLSITELKGR